MKYVSLDIETTGVFNDGGKAPDKILQLSAVIEDCDNPLPLDQLPHFTIFVAQEQYAGEPYALWLNAWIFKELAEWEKTYWKAPELQYKTKYPVMRSGAWQMPFIDFLKRHFGNDRINLAGKNVASFDYQFLPKHVQNKFRGRMIDPGSMFADFSLDALPGLDQICQPLGMSAVTHDAYEDALKVIEVIRQSPQYLNRSWRTNNRWVGGQVPPGVKSKDLPQ